MELNERKVSILNAIIQNYLETGEPVGSRTISKAFDLSPATIRNEMADLEELGYIIQPHTSAGRIPSDKGYRFYVDKLMESRIQQIEAREKEVADMQELLNEKVDRVEELLQNVAKVLANDTNYATMVSSPRSNSPKLKFVQLSQLEPKKLLAVIVMEGNHVRNKFIKISEEIDQETLLKLNLLVNTTLNGLNIEEINLSVISKLQNQAGAYVNIVKEVLDAVAETMSSQKNSRIYTSGANNIFKYPELSDSSKASELISTLEEKELLENLVQIEPNTENTNGIQVYIGDETPVRTMKDCSVVTVTYELSDGVTGTIGIIGPKRMDYEKVVDSLNAIKTQLDTVFKKS